MAKAAFSFPIDFDFYNEHEEQVLFITDDVAGQSMTLEITNTSDKPVILKKLEESSTAFNYHFELVFRPNTLYKGPSEIRLENDQFEMYAPKYKEFLKPNDDGTQSIFFMSKKNWTVQPGEKILLKINHIRAEATDGTRGTRVMLRYGNLYHAGNDQSFSGFKEMHLNIVNHRGKQFIPLHVGFSSPNLVINNGMSNTLVLRITNSSRKDLTIPATAQSKLHLAFESGPYEQEWALAKDDQVKGIKVMMGSLGNMERQEVTEKALVWEIDFVPLAKGQFIELELRNVITNHPAGHANLYLHYENIPGYWDGEMVAAIEKAPMCYFENNVGIGTATPYGKLHIINQNQGPGGNTLILGPIDGSHMRLGYGAENSWIQSFEQKPLTINPLGNNVAIGKSTADASLDVAGTTKVEDLKVTNNMAVEANKEIFFADNGQIRSLDNNHRVIFDRAHDVMELREFGKIIFSPGAVSGERTEKVVISDSGKIGVGTNGPEAKLAVVIGPNERGIEVLSGSSGNTHLPWTDKWNYISGNGVIFRDTANNEKARVDTSNGTITCNAIKIGNTVIGERELQILKKLAAGDLQVDIWNVKQQEYMYAADYSPFDNDRRHVFTWWPKDRINQGQWKLRFPE